MQRLLVRYEETNQSLLKAEEDYRGIVESAPIGIFRLGPDGKPLLVNQ